jgi:diacylglycerol kinase
MISFHKSFGHALRGILVTFKTERNFRFHIVALCFTLALGFYLGLSAIEWCLITLYIGFVLVSELFNTALERLGDEAAAGKFREMVRNAKDISAGAVLLSAFTALAIGVIVLFIPLVHKFLE